MTSVRINKPRASPRNPQFSSGPCRKRPGWAPSVLAGAVVGRSHRSQPAKQKLKAAISRTKALLDVPADYVCAIVPGSDTGAFEMAMWNLLGPQGVDVFSFDAFGDEWARDATTQLALDDVRVIRADYGRLPDFTLASPDRDIVTTANGTTSGARLPSYDWISSDRTGLTFIDATSAAFVQKVDWAKVDVFTFSWQKCLGGEGGHGMLILSPRAIDRLRRYPALRPLPKLFRLTDGKSVLVKLFEGDTINTPSMLCVEDYLDALEWVEKTGGTTSLMARSDANASIIQDWVNRTHWIENLVEDPKARSNTSVCLRFAATDVISLDRGLQGRLAQRIITSLEDAGVALDIGHYRDAPPGLRIWTGPTVHAVDLMLLTPWLDWTYANVRKTFLPSGPALSQTANTLAA